jgi:hypothetical protein
MRATLERVSWPVLALLAAAAVFYKLSVFYRPVIPQLVGAPKVVQEPAGEGLPGRSIRILASPHVAYIGASHAAYDSIPPTSGPHVPWTVAPGIYREQIPEELQVHALEHGHILIQYARSTPANERRKLEAFGRSHPRQVIVAPYNRLKSGIALTAWGRLERLTHPDTRRIETFIDRLSGRYVHGWHRK